MVLSGAPPGGPAPVSAQEAQESRDSVPAYLHRIAESRQSGRGVTAVGTELDDLATRTVGRAVNRLVRQPFRTVEGRRCRPAVYWNGVRMAEAWHPEESTAGQTSLERVAAIEIYFADRDGGLPVDFLEHRCGVIALWVPNPEGGGGGSALRRLALVVLAGIVFFLALGT